MVQQHKLITMPLAELEHIIINGRTTGERSPLTLFWSGSGIELYTTGSQLELEIETDYEHAEQWLSIWINGVQVSRLMLQKGKYWLTLFRGMNPDKVKHVQVVKEVQPIGADQQTLLQFHALRGDGQLQPVESKPVRLEFIGDSITSGEGGIGAREEEDWIPMWFSASDSYAKLTADALGADYRVISQSGWGVLSSWDNNPHHALPLYYEQVCGVLAGERHKQLGAQQAHQFSTWQPHVVVINLGTNDYSAFQQPAWKDEANGQLYKQRLLPDGSFHPDDLVRFELAVQQFLETLRRCNPNAHLLWAYGMLGTPMLPAIYRAVDRYMQQSGDRKVSVFQLPSMTDATTGARSHPGKLAHAKAAEELAGYITELLH